MENYEIWDHHGERRTKASNREATNAPEVREDDDAHFVMVHDAIGDDVAAGGGGEDYCGEDDGEDNEEEEEEDFLDDMLLHIEQELLLKAAKALNNLKTVQKTRKERLYEEKKDV